MDEINYRISRLSSTGKPQENFLYSNIKEFIDSPKRKLMMSGQDYFVNDNDIKDKKRWYIDRKGVKVETTLLSNTKDAHPFFKILVNQKVNYLLAKEFSVTSEDTAFVDALSKRLTPAFYSMIKAVGKDAVINSIGWIQPYYNEKGVLSFKRIPPEEIKAFWADSEHTILDGAIRFYTIKEYELSGNVKDVTKVEYYTADGVWYYIMGAKGLEEDPDKGLGAQAHFMVANETINDKGETISSEIPAVWEKIPLIAFKYNAEEVSLLKWVKPLIDDYDSTTSSVSDEIKDIPNSIKVVKNYDGTDKEEFTHNIATYRTAFVAGDGDVTTLQTPFNTEATEAHLNRLRKDIYSAGSAVDTQNSELGTASGVAIEFRYSDLESDVNDMAMELQKSLNELFWFIKVDMLNNGEGDFMDVDYEIIFNTSMITNNMEQIQQAKDSMGLISDETILANHPWITDVAKEMDKIEKQRKESLKQMQETMEVSSNFGTEQPENNTAEEGEE